MRIQPKKIMCAVDFSNFTDNILSYSVEMCKEFHAKLFVVHVVLDVKALLKNTETSLDLELLQKGHMREAKEHLEELVKDLNIENEFIVVQGNAANEIKQLALEQKIDMVITATHGKSGAQRFLIGSVTEKLIKTLHCPLLVLHTRKHDLIPPASFKMKMKKILVGCDFSPDSKLAFDYGLSLAQEFQAELCLAHVIKPTEYIELKASDYIDIKPGDYVNWRSPDYFEMQRKATKERYERIYELRNKLEKQLYYMVPEESLNWCTPKTTLLDGEPYKELIKYAKEKNMDIIVLGIRGHTLWEKMLVGSTTDRVIRHTSCPVLAVRQMN